MTAGGPVGASATSRFSTATTTLRGGSRANAATPSAEHPGSLGPVIRQAPPEDERARRPGGTLFPSALLATACTPEPTPGPRNPGPLEQRIDEAVAAGFSGVVRIDDRGARLERASGLADREAGVDNTPETAFDVGSITKDLTAALVFRLQEQGRLDLADRLGDVLPDVPPDKADIVLLDVVRHRAGFRPYHDTEGDFEPMTRLEARERILAQKLRFAPGSRYAYSNSGYTLLADIVEERTGSYREAVRSELLAPAGLHATGFYGEVPAATAIGYGAATHGANDPATWEYTWALVGNGGLVTTVGDLAAWFDALPVVLDDYETFARDYLADGAVEVGGELVYSFAGAGDHGLGGAAVDCPACDQRVIVVTNATDDYDAEQLTVDLALLLLDADPPTK